MVKQFRATRTNKNLVKKTSTTPKQTKKAGEMNTDSRRHKFKSQTEKLAQISLNLVDKIEHLAISKEKSVTDSTFTYDEIQKISTFEKNKIWSREIQGNFFYLRRLFAVCEQTMIINLYLYTYTLCFFAFSKLYLECVPIYLYVNICF